MLTRYSKIIEKMPREFLLLQGKGCFWKKCTFCDYHKDVSDNPFAINQPVIDKITGEFGVVDVINSGSALEIDDKSIEYLSKTLEMRNVHTLWLESHWLNHDKLAEFSKKFKGVEVKFRCGVETFDTKMRDMWNKGIKSQVSPEEIAKYFDGICLLIGVKGQKKESIKRDISIAMANFEYFSINAFVENSTPLKRDEDLVKWFEKEIYPTIKNENKIEVLLNNTDLGVG
ncbi:MAG: radical SAM protein [Oscillospiraceae bacterium]